MKFVLVIASVVSAWLIDAWGIMITVGILHGWWSFIPPMGFATAVKIALVSVCLITSSITIQKVMESE